MVDNVFKLVVDTVGASYRFNTDEILEAAKGNEFGRMVILGELPDGTIYVAGTANAGETLILMERAKRIICFGEQDNQG